MLQKLKNWLTKLVTRYDDKSIWFTDDNHVVTVIDLTLETSDFEVPTEIPEQAQEQHWLLSDEAKAKSPKPRKKTAAKIKASGTKAKPKAKQVAKKVVKPKAKK